MGLVVMSGFATLSFATPAPQRALWANPAYQQELLSVLAVNQDGTLRIKSWGKAQQLLGADFAQAAGELGLLNAKIRNGQFRGFKNAEQLQHFELTQPLPQFVSTSTRCQRTCFMGTCCTNGWWFFCWGYGSC